ncbi:hypothetical protein CVT25_012505 [Psilocybe cyanescens]|uniref:Uncharacterized protein n=1 Tax=Psilocybe cyanescens TaxID=93625 RepID=A0A409X4B8_PSICY|nr:hypothetical protein CVT25_012505 [Psilocybe cyanescens]
MGLSVSKDLVVEYFKIFEPRLVKERKAGRLKRHHFWSAGINDLWAVDQRDKWKKFGLALHTGIDPFPEKIHWMKVWWTNNNPKLIASYYIDRIEATRYMPLVSQSDPGSENYGIANAQTVLRHWHDSSLVGTIQHRWMRHKKNVMPEIAWSQLRHQFMPGFEDILQCGVTNDWYDIRNPLDVKVDKNAINYIHGPYAPPQDPLEEAAEYITHWEKQLADTHPRNNLELVSGNKLEGGIDEADGEGQYYMGGINNGQGLDTSHISQLDALEDGDDFELEAQFTDEEYVDAEVIDEW